MDIHHKILYGATAVLAAAIGGVGYELSPPGGKSFEGVPFGHHAYIVYAAPGALMDASTIAKSIRDHGGTVRVEADANSHFGLWIAPKGDESESAAAALRTITGENVIVDDYEPGAKVYGTPYQIGVGIPEAK